MGSSRDIQCHSHASQLLENCLIALEGIGA